MRTHFLTGVFVFVALISSCNKKDIEEISNVPNIEFVRITPSYIKALSDQVVITIKYTDGDGDLGENAPGVKNLFVTDLRNNVQYSLRLQQLSPTGSLVAISGELDINLGTLSLVGDEVVEEVSFEVYVNDRSNNQSNIIQTPPVTISL